jgi:AmmeMemoRadiSam system protein B
LDKQVTDAVREYDPEAVIAAEHAGQGIACGRGALATVMLACGGTKANLERYATSGDVTGDFDRVVGYASASFLE